MAVFHFNPQTRAHQKAVNILAYTLIRLKNFDIIDKVFQFLTVFP